MNNFDSVFESFLNTPPRDQSENNTGSEHEEFKPENFAEGPLPIPTTYMHSPPPTPPYCPCDPNFDAISSTINDKLAANLMKELSAGATSRVERENLSQKRSLAEPILPGMTERQRKGKTPGKRGRKPLAKDPNSVEEREKKAKRAEANRKFARESRSRQLQYTESLEKEVSKLRAQLEYYKKELGKYEMIERQRSLFESKLCDKLYEIYKEVFGRPMDVPDKGKRATEFVNRIDSQMDEWKKSLGQLTRIMTQLMTPLPFNVFLRMSKCGVEFFDSEGLSKIYNGCLPTEQVAQLMECVKSFNPDKKVHNEMLKVLGESAKRIYSYELDVVESQKKIQAEMVKTWQYVRDNLLTKCHFPRVDVVEKLMPLFRLIPKLKQYAVYNIKDSDLSPETTSNNESDVEINKPPLRNGKCPVLPPILRQEHIGHQHNLH